MHLPRPGFRATAHYLAHIGCRRTAAATVSTPIADVPAQDVEFLLDALRDADVPGYAAKVGPPGLRRQCRIWVASLRYSTAEEALRDALNRIHHTLPRH